MKRLLLGLVLVAALALVPAAPARAQPAPEFKLGFRVLADQIPNVVGEPLENEHWGPNGDSLQQTSTGLMVWRKADNWTAFTNGHATWINGPYGVQSRLNTDRFLWEKDAPPRQGVAPQPLSPSVAAWGELFQDQRLRDALAEAYGYALDWRPVAEAAAVRRVPVRWGVLPQGVHGKYEYEVWYYAGGRTEVRNGRITISASLQRESASVLATALAHEATHAATIEGKLGADGCFQGEVAAWSMHSYVWLQMPNRRASTGVERHLEAEALAWRAGSLESYIYSSPRYQEQCSRAG